LEHYRESAFGARLNGRFNKDPDLDLKVNLSRHDGHLVMFGLLAMRTPGPS
jgi:hypothetical protein